MIQHPLFPTLLGENTIPVDPKWLDCIKSLEYGESRNTNYISNNRQVLSLSELSDLKMYITESLEFHVYDVIGVLRNIDIEICRSWAVKNIPGSFAEMHCHSNAIWSGVYYLDVNPDSGYIIFDRGSLNNCFISTLQPDCLPTGWNTTTWKFLPTKGTLFVFPSQLMHSVSKNESDKERYCIGFDVMVRGTFGSPDGSEVTV